MLSFNNHNFLVANSTQLKKEKTIVYFRCNQLDMSLHYYFHNILMGPSHIRVTSRTSDSALVSLVTSHVYVTTVTPATTPAEN